MIRQSAIDSALVPGVLQTGSDLLGSGEDDTIVGGAGNDALFGSCGRDLLIGGAGADLLLGDGKYNPTLTLQGDYTGWRLSQAGTFAIEGFGETELPLWGYLDPASHADTIHGGGGNDMAWGGFGDDLLVGNAANDASYVNSFERRAA